MVILEKVTAFGVLIAVLSFALSAPTRQSARLTQAWQVIHAARGGGGDGGRVRALELLNDNAVNLSGVSLERAVLTEVTLQHAMLRRANMDSTTVARANLCGANLWRANLRQADLSLANLRGALLAGADLRGANLYGVDLSEANLEGVRLDGATISANVLYLAQAGYDPADVVLLRGGARKVPEGPDLPWLPGLSDSSRLADSLFEVSFQTRRYRADWRAHPLRAVGAWLRGRGHDADCT